MPNKRNIDELLLMFADNDSGLITPEMLRDFIVSTIGATGWADYTDTANTELAPQIVNYQASAALEIDGLVSQNQELPFGSSGFWDGANNLITPDAAGDSYIVTVDMKIKRESGTSAAYFDTWFDIGLPGDVKLYKRSFGLASGSSDFQNVTFSTSIYCLDTWVTNGGKIMIYPLTTKMNIAEARVVITKLHSGKGDYS